MSKAVQDQVEQLFQATKDLRSLEEIKPHCEAFNEFIKTKTSYNIKSLGTVLSRAGFYKKFKSLPLEQGKNAESVPKHDAQANVTGNELKHYVLLLCGLDKKDWEARNETTRVSDRLTNVDEGGATGIEIDPDEYIEVAERLLSSDNPHELAVGLIAATGRRPHEILARGKFTPIDSESYQVMFEGQGKKRGEKPVFKISTLFPASYIIERFNQLRKDVSIRELLKQVSNEFPRDISAQNRAIEDRRGNSLRRVVQEYFGGKDDKKPLLNFRHGQEQNDCKALRAACACLATERDCTGSTGAKLYFAGCFLGHITPGEKISDSDLKHITTTLGYSDYYITKPVGYPDAPEKEKRTKVSVSGSTLDDIKTIQSELELPNQQSVISYLVDSYMNRKDIAKSVKTSEQKVLELEAQVNQLQKEKAEMEIAMSKANINIDELETIIDAKIAASVASAVTAALEGQKVDVPISPTSPISKSFDVVVARPVQNVATDWQAKSDSDVWASKAPDAAQEKIRRSYQAICLYNDTVATGDSDRLAITNSVLRDLSGCNGVLIKTWIDAHKDEVISHNAKYGMENKKDPSDPVSYANKGKDINKILSLVNAEFLSKEGFKTGRN
jgi:Telomere resolvase